MQAEPLGITVAGGRLIVAGEIDAASAAAFRAAIRAAAAVIENPPLHVDTSEVSFMDSSGLSALVGAYRKFRGGIRVVAPSRPVKRALELTGVYEHFVGLSTI
jgi:anti-anti-sigma factor